MRYLIPQSSAFCSWNLDMFNFSLIFMQDSGINFKRKVLDFNSDELLEQIYTNV